MARRSRAHIAAAVREIVFGLEDSLVSTLGTVSGIAVGSGDRYIVILSGFVLVAVEAISMAAGSFLSSKSADEVTRERERQDHARILQERINDEDSVHTILKRRKFTDREIKDILGALTRERKLWLREVTRAEYRFHTNVGVSPHFAAIVMGVSYTLGGILVFAPYMILPLQLAALASFVLGFGALFLLGVWKAKLAGVPRVRSGMEMVGVSLLAAVLGVAIGRLIYLVS